ncbi:hypothetical protein HELRODRAFT_112678 [Helobdella robusta]|uniref:CBS domain-containing protein n=1 Tax=Helobdella robusta TaxID=6412 RepID=T1EFL3_HELRO|nr:hypothetical protein HELRODRAFT_112678 [Helobdella robusta]ESO01212.1 hypothetical protein HELRODRAFT_112678 [Helobdella robusta]
MQSGNPTGSNLLKVPQSASSTISNYQQIFDLSNLSPKSKRILIWKEKNRSSQFLNVLEGEEEDMVMDRLDDEPQLVYMKALSAYHCYDLIPTSSKLVVFDTKISIKKAFLALMYTGVRAAPLWNEQLKKYIGMLTITDFIKILRQYYKTPGKDITELESYEIQTWRNVLEEYKRPLVHVSPDVTLAEAIHLLSQQQVHRLPVIDPVTGDALFIVTHKRILRFLFIYIYDMPEPDFMRHSLQELNIGTFKDIVYVKKDTPVIEALNLLMDKNISALPVVDDNMKVLDVYAKFDVINLAPNKAYTDLSVSVEKSVENKIRTFNSVQTCFKSTTLRSAMENITTAEVHRLVIVDSEGRLEGVLSLSDILKFLVARPLHLPASPSHHPHHTPLLLHHQHLSFHHHHRHQQQQQQQQQQPNHQ